ncbi:uncharacterized protein LOC132754094, partial [Ruditapes philippinarum]|uniref:uncharacterized protein LOC132754094 n=1 Tax=Ruditapes philippinarum TaxID=129788 RepID=UPI00295A863C
MNRKDYKNEVLRQLGNDAFYEKLSYNPMINIQENISKCVEELTERNNAIDHEFDVFPNECRTPSFYVLPKTHKQPNADLPLKYPGRPIVSACNSPTENISKYLDSILKPYMFRLPSFIKDTTDFIQKIKNVKLKSKDSLLVTMDVSSLYTCIPHSDGIKACEYFLNEGNSDHNLQTPVLSNLIRIVLENNIFEFNNEFFTQTCGTAMGSSMAPAYASLFMGKLEKDFIESRNIKPTLWLRFLDDIFLIWDDTREELENFIRDLNDFHPTIKFTQTISSSCVDFLDVRVSKNDCTLSTNIFVKNTNNHQYLHYTSCHPKACKNGIPYSQGKRYCRIISDDSTFEDSLVDLKDFFLKREYPKEVIDNAFEKINSMSQNEALRLTESSQSNFVIPFVVTYNPHLPNIGHVLNKYWDLLKLSKSET